MGPMRHRGTSPTSGATTRSAATGSERTLYTIGHSTRTLGELVEIVRAWRVETLVDVRHFTRSRRNPQFNDDVLAAALATERIAYRALAGLGGRRGRAERPSERNAGWENASFRNYADHAETAAFAEAFELLLEMTAGSTCAVMCAEAVWWRCHRRIVADHAIAHGLPVVHIFTATKAEPAALTPFARITRVADGRVEVHYPAEASPTEERDPCEP
jgi:uncharacterized protein (DUF488 family)